MALSKILFKDLKFYKEVGNKTFIIHITFSPRQKRLSVKVHFLESD